MTLSFLTIWVQLLEAWLALTSVKYLDNVSVLILLNRWLKLTMLVFIRHDIVNFVKSFVAWTTPGPSPLVLLFEERVHDLKAVGNGEVDKLLSSIFSITMTEGAYTFSISASNYCVRVTLDDVEVGFVVLHGCVEVVKEIFQFLPERGVGA